LPRRLRHTVLTLAVSLAIAGCSREVSPHAVPESGTQAGAQSAAESATEGPADTAPVPPAPASDSDQVRRAVLDFQDAYNTKRWDTYLSLMCTAMRDQFVGPVLDTLKSTRDDQGLTNVTVTDVEIDGDTGTATLDAQNEMLDHRGAPRTRGRLEGLYAVLSRTPGLSGPRRAP
jgi:hypothetical protein